LYRYIIFFPYNSSVFEPSPGSSNSKD